MDKLKIVGKYFNMDDIRSEIGGVIDKFYGNKMKESEIAMLEFEIFRVVKPYLCPFYGDCKEFEKE